MSILPIARTMTGKRDRGQATVEFVLVLPFLFFFFFVVVDFGWLLKNWIVVTNAAREAARCDVVNNCIVNGTPVSATGLLDARLTAGVTGNLTNIKTDVHYVNQDGVTGIQGGDAVVVCVKGDNKWITPIMYILHSVTVGALPSPMPLGAKEEMRLEVAPKDPTPVGDESCNFP